MENQTGNQMRFIALSTTVANYNDLADWIGASQRGRYNFPLSNRPIPLDIHITGNIKLFHESPFCFLMSYLCTNSKIYR